MNAEQRRRWGRAFKWLYFGMAAVIASRGARTPALDDSLEGHLTRLALFAVLMLVLATPYLALKAFVFVVRKLRAYADRQWERRTNPSKDETA